MLKEIVNLPAVVSSEALETAPEAGALPERGTPALQS